METFRRRSSAIWAETIVPPVQVQVEVLSEIGRRLSSGLQAAGAGVILGGGGAKGDEDVSDSGQGHSLTPPEERYHKDLEVGVAGAGGGVTAATSSDANDNRRFSLMPGLVTVPGGGLVRRTGLHVDKRVSFVELVSTATGGRSGSGEALLGKRSQHNTGISVMREYDV